MFHQFGKSGVWIVDEQADRVHHFAKVVGWNIGRHAHCDPRRTVDQQIGEAGGKHRRLLKAVVVVGGEIHRVLIDIGQHVEGHFAHPRLGIPVGGGGMAVDRTKVSVPIYKRIPQGKVLRHPDHRVVHRGVAVGMVTAQHRTDGVGAFAVGFVRRQPVFMHGIENPPVNGFQTVPHIRQGSRHDDRHGIFQKALFHFLFQVDGDQLGMGGIGLFLQG